MSDLPTANFVCPDVSFILREPFEQYLANSRENLTSHGLGDFRKCPALYRKKKLGLIADEDRPAYLIGRAVHTLVLEGRDRFEAEYAVGGPINPRTGEVYGSTTKAFAEWAAAQGKAVLTVAQFDLVENMADGVRQNGAARDLLSEGIAEGVVRREYRDIPAQIRMDFFDPHRGVVDLKTCDDLGWFEADARRYGYAHAQPRTVRRRLQSAVLGVPAPSGRPDRPQLADAQRPWETGGAPRRVRHELLEVVRACPPGRCDGRQGVSVALRRSGRQHRLLAEHLTAEYRVKTEGRGRTVDEWKLRPEASENHWLDCLVGCAVAASIQGAVLPGTDVKAAPRRPRIRLSDLQQAGDSCGQRRTQAAGRRSPRPRMPPVWLQTFSRDLYPRPSRGSIGASPRMPALWAADDDVGTGYWLKPRSRRFGPHKDWLGQADHPQDIAASIVELDPLTAGKYEDSNMPAHEAPADVESVLDQDRGVDDRELGVRDAEFLEDIDDRLMHFGLSSVVHNPTLGIAPKIGRFVSEECSEASLHYEYQRLQRPLLDVSAREGSVGLKNRQSRKPGRRQ